MGKVEGFVMLLLSDIGSKRLRLGVMESGMAAMIQMCWNNVRAR